MLRLAAMNSAVFAISASVASADGARLELYPAAMPVVDGAFQLTAGIDVTASVTPYRSTGVVGKGLGLELQASATYFPTWDATLVRGTVAVTADFVQRMPKLGPFGGDADGHFMIGPTLGRFWRDGAHTVVGGTFTYALRFVQIGSVKIDAYVGFTLLIDRQRRPSDQVSHSILGFIDGIGVRVPL